MKKQNGKKKERKAATGLEIIAVQIGGKVLATYKGLGGTFASFADSCLRKQVLPGFDEKGLIAGAFMKDKSIELRLSGKRSAAKLREAMDIALLNTGAYPDSEVRAKYIINVASEK